MQSACLSLTAHQHLDVKSRQRDLWLNLDTLLTIDHAPFAFVFLSG